MHAIVPATLLALSLAAPALAEPETSFELPAGSALERFQRAPTARGPAPVASGGKDPLPATLLTGGSAFVLGFTALALTGTGELPGALGLEMVAPLVLGTGYLYAEAPWWHAPLVVAGGYAAEFLGLMVGGEIARRTSPGSFSGLHYLTIGPAVALMGYGAWAGYDAYRSAVRYNERQLKAAGTPTR